jgi:O-antigen biosynthesis protein WbqP
MKRVFDLVLCSICGVLFLIPIFFIGLLVHITSHGPVIYWSDRVGRFNKLFKMPKFRSMHILTPTRATHMLEHPDKWLTPIGSILRKSSLDELPQLWSIFKGDMSFVGPRPALFNQDDLIKLRTNAGVHKLVPGLTGWAQINGRDKMDIIRKVQLDVEYMNQKSIFLDLKILLITLLKALLQKQVSH